jgi:hypothetical protein
MSTNKPSERRIIKRALSIGELEISLQDIAQDDGKTISEYSDEGIVDEAKYVLGKFTGESGGFSQEEDLLGDNGPEQKKWARSEVAKLRRFIKTFDVTPTATTKVFV